MSGTPIDSKRFSLRRWSQRKHAAARGDPAALRDSGAAAVAPNAPVVGTAVQIDAPAGSVAAGVPPETNAADSGSTAAVTGRASEPAPLPALESLTIDSDYSPFMRPNVDEAMKRSALKKLFADPRFNVMDGLDVYIDDYSKPDPIDAAVVRSLVQARYIFNPPPTRVNAAGHVEDVPDAEPAGSTMADDGPPGADAALASSADATTVANAGAPVPAPASGAAQDTVTRTVPPAATLSADADGQVVAATPATMRK